MTFALALSLVVSASVSCDDEGCQEPDPRGQGQLGDSCISTRDCEAGLACIGRDFMEDAVCSSPENLPGGADPGCLEHVDDWEHHVSDGSPPTSDDREGCDRLLFVSSCNCQGSADEECVPIQPFYRQEFWRSCNGCCWRLVAFWQDDEFCEDLP